MKYIPIKNIPNLVQKIKSHMLVYPNKGYHLFLKRCLYVPDYIPTWKIYQAQVAYTYLYYRNTVYLFNDYGSERITAYHTT